LVLPIELQKESYPAKLCSVKFLTCLPRIAFNGQVNINNAFTPNIYLFTDYTYVQSKEHSQLEYGRSCFVIKE